MYGSVVGNVGRDSVLKSVGDRGTMILEFPVGEKMWKKGGEITTWYQVSIFGKKAESLEQHIKKGTAVTVIGQSYEDRWTDENNDERKILKVSASTVIIQSRVSAAQRPSGAQSYENETLPPSRPANPLSSSPQRFEDDIPF